MAVSSVSKSPGPTGLKCAGKEKKSAPALSPPRLEAGTSHWRASEASQKVSWFRVKGHSGSYRPELEQSWTPGRSCHSTDSSRLGPPSRPLAKLRKEKEASQVRPSVLTAVWVPVLPAVTCAPCEPQVHNGWEQDWTGSQGGPASMETPHPRAQRLPARSRPLFSCVLVNFCGTPYFFLFISCMSCRFECVFKLKGPPIPIDGSNEPSYSSLWESVGTSV